MFQIIKLQKYEISHGFLGWRRNAVQGALDEGESPFIQITSRTKSISYLLSDGLCNFSRDFPFLHYQITTFYSSFLFALEGEEA